MSTIGNVSNTKGKVLIIDGEEDVSSVGVEQRGEQDMPAFSRVGGLLIEYCRSRLPGWDRNNPSALFQLPQEFLL